MDETSPLPLATAFKALVKCAARSALLLGQGRVHLPSQRIGQRLHFADGTTGTVYRETVVDRNSPTDPAVLVVEFRLWLVRGRAAHAMFRAESLLNTPLFVGFPGFCSKLWLTHDAQGAYRGFYQWDGAGAAEAYARALWWVLALVSVRRSIRFRTFPGARRDELLEDPHLLAATPSADGEWCRLTGVDPVAA